LIVFIYLCYKLDVNNEGPTVSNEQVTNNEAEESFYNYNAPPPGQLYSSSFNPYQVTDDRQQSVGFNPYQVTNDTQQQSIGFNPYPMRMEQKQFYQQGGQQYSTPPSTISTGFPQYSTNDKYNHNDNVSPPPPSYSSGGRFNINPVQRQNNSNHGFFPRAHVGPPTGFQK
jgi:hypothetical protein